MRVLGIDPASSRLAAVVYDGAGWRGWWYPKLGTSPFGPHNLEAAWRAMIEVLDESSPTHVFVESPIVGRGGVRTTAIQAMTSGVIQLSCTLAGVPVYLVHPSSWKALIVKGNATKDEVREWVAKRRTGLIKEYGNIEDVMDAAAIAYYGWETVRRAT